MAKKITDPEMIALLESLESQQAPQTSGFGALGVGAAQGLTFGTSDEITAGAGALYDYATGAGDLSSSYDKRVKAQRDYIKAAREENPGWYYGGEIAGAVALPFSAPGRVAARGAQVVANRLAGSAARAPLRNAAARGAVEGAGYGALYGAGQSEGGLQARAEGAVGGGLMGGAIGGVAAPAVTGIAQGARAAWRGTTNALMPERAATRAVAEAQNIDVNRANRRPLPNQSTVDRMLRGPDGDEIRVLDTGETTRALGRRAANLSPEARETLNDVVNPRFESQAPRMATWLRQRNPLISGDNAETRETIQSMARQVNRPSYERAFQQGDRPLNSPLLERLQTAPEVRQAMQAAVPEFQNRQVIDGYQGFNARVQVTPDGQITFNRGPEGPPAYPNLAFWDTVKRELDKQAQRNLRETGSRGTAGQFARELRNELDNMVPSYRGTRSQAAEFFNAENAVDAGENFARMGARGNYREWVRAFNQMTPGEQTVFRNSYQNELLNQIENVKDRQTIVNKFARSDAERQKLRLGLGRDLAREFEAKLYIETLMDRGRNAIQGNSTTVRQLMEMNAGTVIGGGSVVAGSAWLSGGDVTQPSFWGPLLLAAGARRMNNTQAQRWSRQIAELLANRPGRSQAALQRMERRLARNDQLIETLRAAVTRTAGVGGGAIGGRQGAQVGATTTDEAGQE